MKLACRQVNPPLLLHVLTTHTMASVWRDLNVFMRNGGPSDSVISRAHRAVRSGEHCSWQVQDHVMGMGEYGTMVQGVVLSLACYNDAFIAVQPPGQTSPCVLRLSSAIPVLVVDMKDALQRQRLAQLQNDARMDLVWTKLAVHCTSHDALLQLPTSAIHDITRMCKTSRGVVVTSRERCLRP